MLYRVTGISGFLQTLTRPFIYVPFAIYIVACVGHGSDRASKDARGQEAPGTASPRVFEEVEPARVADSLGMREYGHWLTLQRGLTYAETENEALAVALLYRPLVVEAARNMEPGAGEEALRVAVDLKKDYLYFQLSWQDKIVSVNKASGDKERLAGLIRSSLLVETGSGVVYNAIVEAFPPALLNQPGRMLILVPASSFRDWIELRFRGEKIGLEDAVLRLTSSDINSLPKLKL